jgi:hypothetical protein
MNGAAMALKIVLPYMPSWDFGSLQKKTANFQEQFEKAKKKRQPDRYLDLASCRYSGLQVAGTQQQSEHHRLLLKIQAIFEEILPPRYRAF